ncbi:MAG: mechanosensitive ion channel family protein [Gammaproteobacteria bacterium]|nr:mechanosensitive ion channel family protein [Gammaproteobacteria bacterium]MDH3888319.1 mechanosensitive ion channel family protein [Gammaproteobacteria bacterium]
MLSLWHQAGVLAADAGNPLSTADTSSPRETLRGFVETLNQGHAQVREIITSYLGSSRLYLSAAERNEVDHVLERIELARRTLNLSELPAALSGSLSTYRVLQLKEVIDRIELPAFEAIPDAAAMQSEQFKRWSLPGTEITIALVEQGPRAGEYLFSPQTVGRLPEFYRRIKHLPYRPAATAGWYESYRYGGAGLRRLIPYKWMMALPDWAKVLILDQPVWRWFGMVMVLLAAAGLFRLIRRAAAAWAKRGSGSELRSRWSQVAWVIAMLILIPVVIHVLVENLRLSGHVLEVATLSLWGIFTLMLTWAVWLTSTVLAESVVASQQLLAGSIDSQLIRLGMRLVATILSVTILVIGAQQLGIPAYSVIAGLGVGGIAVALAAKDSLANLLGSLLIMFEKPFRVGHWIKVGNTEGIVESIGFRSTRIRTFYNSLISIPSNQLVNTTVDNMAMRQRRAVRTVLHVSYTTPADKVEQFVAAIKQLIEKSPYTYKEWFRIRLDDFGDYGLHILVNFLLEVSDNSVEQAERQRILLEILKLAETMDIQFAIPPRMPSGENTSGQDSHSLPQ